MSNQTVALDYTEMHTGYSVIAQPVDHLKKVNELETSVKEDVIDVTCSGIEFGIGFFLDGIYAPAALRTFGRRLGKDYGIKSKTGELTRFAGQGTGGLVSMLGTGFVLQELATKEDLKHLGYAVGALVLTNVLSYYASRKKSIETKQ